MTLRCHWTVGSVVIHVTLMAIRMGKERTRLAMKIAGLQRRLFRYEGSLIPGHGPGREARVVWTNKSRHR